MAMQGRGLDQEPTARTEAGEGITCRLSLSPCPDVAQ